jgi:hypothetical protein
MSGVADVLNWLIALVVMLSILGVLAGLVTLVFAYPVGSLWFAFIAFLFFYMHKG